jgi:serine/threonine protein phosphatase PrpC
MSNELEYIYSSVKGIRQNENRDACLVLDKLEFIIFAVFDGVSSAAGGKTASVFAKSFVKSNVEKFVRNKIDIKGLMNELNCKLLESGIVEPYCTYCFVYYNKSTTYFDYSWLGDSRIYLVTNKFIEQFTIDDHYSGNYITYFLGKEDLVLSDFRQLRREKGGQHLLLCTDGFYNILESNRLVFFDYFQNKSLPRIRFKIGNFLKGKNVDDSTYIFVK